MIHLGFYSAHKPKPRNKLFKIDLPANTSAVSIGLKCFDAFNRFLGQGTDCTVILLHQTVFLELYENRTRRMFEILLRIFRMRFAIMV